MDTDSDRWFTDIISRDFRQLHRIEEVLYAGKTKYQTVEVFRSARFGVCLALDGKIQSTERDEFIYHEALVQPAMIAHAGPETVFIAGGGEGATLREVLRHRTVKKAVMVEIDEAVTALSRQYLPALSGGAFEGNRAELHHVDARQYLENTKDKYDVIIIDLPDPIEKGPAYLLFTQEFYKIVYNRLTESGLVAVQAGSASPLNLMNFTAVNNTLKSIFPTVVPYIAYVPCYGGPWGLCLASRRNDPSSLTIEEVDSKIASRELGGLRFYDGATHRRMYSLPKYVREALAGQERIITDKRPLYLYDQ
jgi:spermidine synthase